MPQIRIRDAGGVLRTITRIRMRDAGNVLRTLQQVRMRDATNVLRVVFTYLNVTLDTYSEVQTASGADASGLVTSDAVTGTVTGGTAPFTYAWEFVSGDIGMTVTTPTADNTTFSMLVASGVDENASYRLKVTDANGAIAYSPSVAIRLRWIDTR